MSLMGNGSLNPWSVVALTVTAVLRPCCPAPVALYNHVENVSKNITTTKLVEPPSYNVAGLTTMTVCRLLGRTSRCSSGGRSFPSCPDSKLHLPAFCKTIRLYFNLICTRINIVFTSGRPGPEWQSPLQVWPSSSAEDSQHQVEVPLSCLQTGPALAGCQRGA